MAKSMAFQFEPSDGHRGFPGLNLDHTTRLRICRTLLVLEDSTCAVTACRKGHHCAVAMWNTTWKKFGEKMLLIAFSALKFYGFAFVMFYECQLHGARGGRINCLGS